MKQTRRLDLFLDQKPNTSQVLLYSTKLQSRKKNSEHTRKQRCLQVCLLICPSSSVCLSVCLPVCLQLSVCLSVCLPVCLCLCHSLWRRANARNFTFITRYGGQFTFSTLSKHVCLSVCLSVCLLAYLLLSTDLNTKEDSRQWDTD